MAVSNFRRMTLRETFLERAFRKRRRSSGQQMFALLDNAYELSVLAGVQGHKVLETVGMMNTSIRLALPSEASSISDLVNSAYRGDHAKAGWTTEADLLEGTRTKASDVASLIGAPGNAVLVSVDGSAIVGCVHLEKKDETTAYLGMLTTNPRLQSKGLGSELMIAGEEFVRMTWGLSKIEMTVIDVRRELIAYYERRGFALTGETRPFPEDPANGRSKVGPLTFVVLEKVL